VAGLGNLLLRDDGVGVHAVRALRKRDGRRVWAVEIGTAVLDALHLFEAAGGILAIDAIQAGGPPGTIYRFRPSDLEDRPAQGSLHAVNLVSARHLLPGPRPEIVILGVEPKTIDYGLTLSPPVQAALPRLLEEAEAILARWRQEPGPARGRPARRV